MLRSPQLRAVLGPSDLDSNDFDMRGLERAEKMRGKKLKGARKKREERREKDVAGKSFVVDAGDDRFAAVFSGGDSR